MTPGTKLGPYEIVALLGAGGMGEVYRAHDPRVGRDVAIKISQEQFSERFAREARAVASLNHPNICTLYDVGPNFLVMELVEGESPEGPLPLDEALRIARQIVDALSEAHEKGVTHRDLKPGNIKIKPDGTVKVLDFGLAKLSPAREGGGSDLAATQSPTLSMAATQAGMILGTAAYMAPEQAKGKPVDRRADIWAFGVVLHELLTGRRLFEAEDVTETLASVVLKEPDWEGVPQEVRRLLKKCLAKDPKQRLRDIGDVWELLEEPLAPSVAASEPVRSRRAMAGWASAAVVTLALGTLAFVHFRETPPPEHTLRYTIAPPEGASVHSFAVSPDGRLLAMAATTNGKRQLWIRPMDALQWQPMPSTDDARYPFWSPDSRNIAFFAEGKIRKIAASGGPSQPVCDAADARGGSWSRDDVIVFSASGSPEGVIQRVSAAGGIPTAATQAKSRVLFPTFLPDDRHFLYEVGGISAEKNGIYVASLDGKENRRILNDTSSAVFAPAASGERSGHVLFIRENNLMAQPFDAGSLQTSGDVFPVAEGVGLANGNNYAPVAASSNGVLLYWTGGAGGAGSNFQLVWYDRSGKVVETVGPLSNIVMPALSPDEKTVAFSKQGGGAAERDIWLRDLVRGSERRLTTDASTNVAPFFSPDGKQIAFRSNRGTKQDLYARASSGAGENELLVSTPNSKLVNQWSRDGRFIVYSEVGPKRWDLWYLPMGNDGKPAGKPVAFLHSEFNEVHGQLSPDSRWMAYTSEVSGQREVYVQPFPSADNEIRISTAGGEQPRWRADSKELFYLGADGKIASVTISVSGGPKPSLKAGTPVPLFDAHSSIPPGQGGNVFNYDVTADGKRFLVSATGAAASVGSGTPPVIVLVNWNAPKK